MYTPCSPFNQNAGFSLFLNFPVYHVNSHRQFPLAETLHLVECQFSKILCKERACDEINLGALPKSHICLNLKNNMTDNVEDIVHHIPQHLSCESP